MRPRPDRVRRLDRAARGAGAVSGLRRRAWWKPPGCAPDARGEGLLASAARCADCPRRLRRARRRSAARPCEHWSGSGTARRARRIARKPTLPVALVTSLSSSR